MRKRKKRYIVRHLLGRDALLVCGLLLLYQGSGIAANNVDVLMSGKLLAFPPCEVYGNEGKGAPIRIGFGEVGIQRIDGQRFRQDWTLTVSCDATLGTNIAIQLAYNGSPSKFDDQALLTNKEGLGVRLYHKEGAGAPVALNTPIILTMSSSGEQKIYFYSVPVRDPKATLIAGNFTASATLALNYP